MKPLGYIRTPNLRKKVMKCIDQVVADGWRLQTGCYVTDGHCCALGAISLCDAAPSSKQWSRGRSRAFALSLNHLGCHPIELDSIEAGFEFWSWTDSHGSKQTVAIGALDRVAFNIGRDIRLRFTQTSLTKAAFERKRTGKVL